MIPASFITLLTIAALISFFTAVAQDTKSAAKPAPTAEKAKPAHKNVGVEAFDKLRQSGTNVVLDVRTKKEYDEAHLPGAVHIDIAESNFDAEIAQLDKNKTYLVHCAAGGRSVRACKKMELLGFKGLYNLEGGLTAWQKAGKPVEK